MYIYIYIEIYCPLPTPFPKKLIFYENYLFADFSYCKANLFIIIFICSFLQKMEKKNWNLKKNQNSKNAQSGYIFSYFSKKWIKCLTKVSFLVNMFKWKLHFWIQFFWYSAASVLTFFYHKMLLRQKMTQMEVLQPFHLPKMMNFNIKYILLRIFQCLCRGRGF